MLELEFGLIDIIVTAFLSSASGVFIALFMLGASIQNREGKAYKEGYYKGFEDGKKVGGANDV